MIQKRLGYEPFIFLLLFIVGFNEAHFSEKVQETVSHPIFENVIHQGKSDKTNQLLQLETAFFLSSSFGFLIVLNYIFLELAQFKRNWTCQHKEKTSQTIKDYALKNSLVMMHRIYISKGML